MTNTTQTDSLTFLHFSGELDKWEDEYLLPLSRMTVSLLEAGEVETMETVSKMIPDALKAVSTVVNLLVDYLTSGLSDLTEKEAEVLQERINAIKEELDHERSLVLSFYEVQAAAGRKYAAWLVENDRRQQEQENEENKPREESNSS